MNGKDNNKNNDKIKKTHNQSRVVITNISNKVAMLNDELAKKNYNININAVPKLLELFGYILTHHQDSVGVSQDKDYYNIKIKKETMKKILFSENTDYLWHDFQVDMINLAKKPIWRNVYLQDTNETALLQPISIKEFRYKDKLLNNLEIKEWDEIFIDYSVRFFTSSKSHFTIPTSYHSYVEHYTKTLKPLIMDFAHNQYGANVLYNQNTQDDMKTSKRSIYITHDKIYSIINYLLDTDNKSENREEHLLNAKRTINLVELAKRCYPYCMKKTKNENITLRYKELECAIFQSLFIHNCILLHTGSIENKYIRLTCDIMSLEINKPERKAFIDIINLKDLQTMFNIRLCLFMLETETFERYTKTFNEEASQKLSLKIKKLLQAFNDIDVGISFENLIKIYNSNVKIKQLIVRLIKYYLKHI